jgi:hypothetical protein
VELLTANGELIANLPIEVILGFPACRWPVRCEVSGR